MKVINHQNQFDKIRMLAALGVIISHHFSLTGTQGPFWLENRWLNWAFMGGVSVMAFLCISGYLVTQSWCREPRFFPYLWKRFVRIWPGMLGSVSICVFVFGLIFTALPTGEFLQSPQTRRFFLSNLTLVIDYNALPSVFLDQPVPLVMNGVYWTIPMEFMCYLVLGALGVLGVLRIPLLVNALALAYIAGFLVFANYDFTGQIRHWIEYPAFFIAGSWLALHNDWFQRNARRIMTFAVPLLLIVYFFTPLTATARFFLLPILIVHIGNLPARDSWFTRLGDPSFGIYLYGFPIAQSVIAVFPHLNFWLSLALTIALSIAAGYASWMLIESRALRYKRLFARKQPTSRLGQPDAR